jgi:hypothetical protein
VAQPERDEVTALNDRAKQFLVPGLDTMLFPYVYPDSVAPTVAAFVDGDA